MNTRCATLLEHRHDEIDAVAHALLDACMVVDEPVLRAAYLDVEQAVREHLAAEDALLVPAYERGQPDDARSIKREHAALRKLLDELAVEAEGHALRPCSLGLLVQRLYDHAEHEDDGMYAWFEAEPPRRHRAVVAGLLRSLRRIARVRARFARPRTVEAAASRDMRE